MSWKLLKKGRRGAGKGRSASEALNVCCNVYKSWKNTIFLGPRRLIGRRMDKDL